VHRREYATITHETGFDVLVENFKQSPSPETPAHASYPLRLSGCFLTGRQFFKDEAFPHSQARA
jgi:hypothetical protein